MYSQYMGSGFAPLDDREGQRAAAPSSSSQPSRAGDLLRDLTGSLGKSLGGILKQFSAYQLDTGDILLVLIILFLFLEGDNLDIVITLALMLLLGLGSQPTE